MINNPIISIIVPVYNAEKYLDKCLESIISQTFKNFEVILINDGSNDKSLEICRKYEKKDDRINVIDKENTGAADSRNIGLEIARGKYIGFVDSDDYIKSDMYECLYNLINDTGSDVSICGLIHKYLDKEINPYPREEEMKVSGKEALKIALIGDKFSLNIYNKLYKKELFKNIKFPDCRFAEDAYVTTRILYASKFVSYNTNPKYYWVKNPGSVTNSNFDQREWQSVKIHTDNLDFIDKNCPDLHKEGLCRYYLSYFWILDKMIISSKGSASKDEIKKAVRVLRRGYFDIMISPYFSIKRKLSETVLLVSLKLYEKIIKNFK